MSQYWIRFDYNFTGPIRYADADVPPLTVEFFGLFGRQISKNDLGTSQYIGGEYRITADAGSVFYFPSGAIPATGNNNAFYKSANLYDVVYKGSATWDVYGLDNAITDIFLVGSSPDPAIKLGPTQTLESVSNLGYQKTYAWSDWVWVKAEIPWAAGALLFTEGADEVNFNGLTPAQNDAVSGNADIYNALDGADRVTLPDLNNANRFVSATKTLGWNFGTPFNAGAGDDIIFGGNAGDTIVGGRGEDRLFGNAGGDILSGDTPFSAEGSGDFVYGGDGADLLSGGAGNDFLDGGQDDDTLDGGDGDDVLFSNDGANSVDILTGGAGKDIYVVSDRDVITDFAIDDSIIFPTVSSPDFVLVAFDGQRTYINQFDNALESPLQTVTIENGVSSKFFKVSVINGIYTGLYVEKTGVPSPTPFAQVAIDPDHAQSTMMGKLTSIIPGPFLQVGIGEEASKELILSVAVRHLIEERAIEVGTGLVKTLAKWNVAGIAVNITVDAIQIFTDELNGKFAHDPQARVDAWTSALVSAVLPTGVSTAVLLGKAFWAEYINEWGANLEGFYRAFQFGTNGNDYREGTNKSDYMFLGPGNDKGLTFGGNDTFIGGSGEGNDYYDGGDGIDEIHYPSATLPLEIDLGSGIALGSEVDADVLLNIENVFAGRGADRVIGSNFANVLNGNDGNDRIYGGAGNDELSGEGGNDLLMGDSGNNSLDGGAGRDIAQYGGVREDYALQKVGHAVIVRGPDGLDQLHEIEHLKFVNAATPVPKRANLDFGSDGRADLVLRNESTGAVDILEMHGARYGAYNEYNWGSAWYASVLRPDFNGDGKTDLILGNEDTGAIDLLQMDGSRHSAYHEYAWGKNWLLVSAESDFNGDGKTDLVLQDWVKGEFAFLLMDGPSHSDYRQYSFGSDAYFLSSNADVNGDGKSDVVIGNSGGGVTVLQMDGAAYVESAKYAWGASWYLVTAESDFNGDGKTDLVLRNFTTGAIDVLQLDGPSYSAYQEYKWGPDWIVVESKADFNGDAKSDLVLRNIRTGAVDLLQMDGPTYGAYAEYNWGRDWQVVNARGDFNGDGNSDLVLRNDKTGAVDILQLNGPNYTAYHEYAWGASWKVAESSADFNGDGKSDLVLRNSVTGALDVLTMDGPLYTAYHEYAWGPATQIADVGSDVNNDGKADFILRNDLTGTITVLQMDGSAYSEWSEFAWGPSWRPSTVTGIELIPVNESISVLIV